MVPSPNFESTVIFPWWISTSSFTIESPIPVPPSFMKAGFVTLKKRSNIFSLSISEMPMPLSRTVSFMALLSSIISSSAPTKIKPPFCVNFSAFDNRFQSIFSTFGASINPLRWLLTSYFNSIFLFLHSSLNASIMFVMVLEIFSSKTPRGYCFCEIFLKSSRSVINL